MGKLVSKDILNQLSAKFGADVFNNSANSDLPIFNVSVDSIIGVLTFLKSSEDLNFNFLTDLTAVHYPEEKQICIVYHLHSFVNNTRIRLKVYLTEEQPSIASATVLWDGANWMERETYDFFGVNFIGHPDLRRILNVDDMTVFPMRKEFPLEDPNRVDKKDYFFGR